MVIAIIGILIALLLPAVQAAREAARRLQCQNRLKQLALAAHNYQSTTGFFPSSSNGAPARFSYLVQLLPYIEMGNIHDPLDYSRAWYHSSNLNFLRDIPVSQFKCPSFLQQQQIWLDNSDVATELPLAAHYLAVMGAKNSCPSNEPYSVGGNPDGGRTCPAGGYAFNGIMFLRGHVTPAHVRDGLSNTLLIGEFSWSDHPTRWWAVGNSNGHEWSYGGLNVAHGINSLKRPEALHNDTSFGSMHPGGCHFAIGDGSVRFISESIELTTYKALSSRASGQPAQLP